jgi:hypothetical protein
MADSRTRITMETERTLVVARRLTARGWCRTCGREVAVSLSDEARRLLDAARTQTEGRAHGHLHRRWAESVLVACLRPLQGLLQSKRERPRS